MQPRERMFGEGRDHAGLHIRGRAQVEGDVGVAQGCEQTRIVGRGDAVGDTVIAARTLPPWLPPAAASPLTGCGWRGKRSSDRTLSVTSTWDASTLSPTVAELQDASNPSDVRAKMAARPPRIVGQRPTVPTRCMKALRSD